ncbi:MAG: Response regulator containing CheY-like receiver domain and AraC-type DNA-binding domain [Lacrimispora sp.]|nr:Response regulator containing CheY-like receiver domain and AraC-type DNA-binding domain [Lacrimispora sp.]
MYSVLLVEDEDIIRKGIRSSVPWESCESYVIGEASNGIEGKMLIEELKPDIVITDINMPVMDGLQMIANTKNIFDYVAIILTGYSDFEYAMEAIRNGVSTYVLKPLNMEEMKEALEQAVLESKNIHYLRERNEKTKELENISLIEEKKCIDPVVQQILQYIEEHYQEKIVLSDLEEVLHYSERYINLKFRKVLGTTVIEYLNRLRIQKALALLKDRNTVIADVGFLCGIGDYKYFNHVFKKYIGCSAREYQNRVL